MSSSSSRKVDISVKPNSALETLVKLHPGKTVSEIVVQHVDLYFTLIIKSLPDLSVPEWSCVVDALGADWEVDERGCDILAEEATAVIDERGLDSSGRLMVNVSRGSCRGSRLRGGWPLERLRSGFGRLIRTMITPTRLLASCLA